MLWKCCKFSRMKKIIIFFFVIINSSLFSLGIEINSSSIFLEKNKNKYYPEAVNEVYFSIFHGFNFEFPNQSLFLQPGFFFSGAFDSNFKNQNNITNINFSQNTINNKQTKINTILPFFRCLNYSAFSEHLFFTIGKNSFYFGEGYLANYFFINVPNIDRDNSNLWNVKFEIPLKSFTTSFGVAIDTENIDLFKIPNWYNVWLKTEYSNPYISAGIELDSLFKPKLKAINQKEVILKQAIEVNAILPKNFKLYTNAKLPIDLIRKKITNWGILIGGAKTAILKKISFTSILEASYSTDVIGYAAFQNFGLDEYSQITAGLRGGVGIYDSNQNDLKFILETIFFISKLNIKFTYVSMNILNKEDKVKSILSIGVLFNE